MSNGSNLRQCKYCNNEFAKSAKECPFCEKKVNSGLLLKLIVGIGALAIIGSFAISAPESKIKDILKILDAPVNQISAPELARTFNNKNTKANNQIKSMVEEIKGKIIKWDLEVFVITKSPDCYKIVTKPTFDAPGTLLTLYPQDNQQKLFLDSLSAGSIIKVKGRITGTQNRRIKIDPAIII